MPGKNTHKKIMFALIIMRKLNKPMVYVDFFAFLY